MKKIIIGIFGGGLNSVNYGVTALTISQIKVLNEVALESNVKLEYWMFSDENEMSVDKASKILHVDSIVAKYVIRIKSGLKGLLKLNKDMRKCDVIIDLTYGDSFSDIYGLKVFWLFALPKLMAIKNKQKLIIGPQTIGPFYRKSTEKIAKYILGKSDYIVARDKISWDEAKELTGRNDIILSSDLAMELPYNNEAYLLEKNDKINIGVNVSVLLWYKNSNNSNFNISAAYKEFTYELINKLIDNNMVVYLVTHVYEENKAEYKLAQELHNMFPQTKLAPYFDGPVDAKNFISGLDVFIGARMHATIAAFSSGVPVIPVSYSRKFEGLYGSLGYNHVVQCEENLPCIVVDAILDKINNIDILKRDVKNAYENARNYNKGYYDMLKRIISDIY